MLLSRENYDNFEAVEAAYPAAALIIEVEGGWMIFETASDFDEWERQK